MTARRQALAVNSVGHGAGYVNLWMQPLWIRDEPVPAVLSPKTARTIALRLLASANAAESQAK